MLYLADADFSSLTTFDVRPERGNESITSISLKNAVLNQISLTTLLDSGEGLCSEGGDKFTPCKGIGDLNGITEMDLSGIDFGNITDLAPLYVMDDLTDLKLVNTVNLDSNDLEGLFRNLGTIEGSSTEGILYMTEANFDAFNAEGGGWLAAWDDEPGRHVEFIMTQVLSWSQFGPGTFSYETAANWTPNETPTTERFHL